eukprot:COSAG04_NODE_583_length_12401_cov_6.259307_1_plen_64_part_10
MIPGSHTRPNEDIPQSAWPEEARDAPHPEAVHVTGEPGSVCIMDCRIWVSGPVVVCVRGGGGGG